VTSQTFYFPESKIRSPYQNLAIEEAISLNMNKFNLMGGIRLWRNPRTIVLGLSENPKLTIKEHIIDRFVNGKHELTKNRDFASDFTYIARRASGGGTVFHDPSGNINYSIYVNLELRKELFSVKDSYDILLGIVRKSLAKQLIASESKGKSDITITEDGILKKISGNAQFRKKNCIVQHGTLILQNRLIDEVSEVLLHPPEEPDYRKARNHRDFLTSLPNSFDVQTFGKDLFDEFHSYLDTDLSQSKEDFSFFSRGFSSFRRSVLKDSENIRKQKYESLSYILNREVIA